MEYVNDLPSVIQHCIPFMLAGDTKRLRIIKEPNDAFLMQLDLNNLSAWRESSDLSFNQLKANLSICISGTIRLKLLYQQNKRDSTKDLGIILSNSLDWSDHYHPGSVEVLLQNRLNFCKKETIHITSQVTST